MSAQADSFSSSSSSSSDETNSQSIPLEQELSDQRLYKKGSLQSSRNQLSHQSPSTGIGIVDDASRNEDELQDGILDENLLKLIRKVKPQGLQAGAEREYNPYRVSYLDYLLETSEEERHLLSSLVESFISTALFDEQQSRPVYLDGLGILFPVSSVRGRSQTTEDRVFTFIERCYEVGFEKCYDIDDYARKRHPDLIEIHELTKQVSGALPGFIRWDEKRTMRYLRGLFQLIKYQVVVEGVSEQFESLGQFLSLHNRQGSNLQSWYAGADIFLRSHLRKGYVSKKRQEFHRPILRNAWEPFESLYGEAEKVFDLRTADQLSELGYDESLFPERIRSQRLRIAAFRVCDTNSKQESYLYCTDGMRAFGLEEAREQELGTELILQIPIESNSVPDWPIHAFTIGWILLNSSRTKNASIGDGMSVGVPIAPQELDTTLNTIFVTQYKPIRSEMLSPDGPFMYKNIVGVTDDEAEVASRYTPDLLLAFLEHRKHDQLTRLKRKSVVANTKLPHGESSNLFIRL